MKSGSSSRTTPMGSRTGDGRRDDRRDDGRRALAGRRRLAGSGLPRRRLASGRLTGRRLARGRLARTARGGLAGSRLPRGRLASGRLAGALRRTLLCRRAPLLSRALARLRGLLPRGAARPDAVDVEALLDLIGRPAQVADHAPRHLLGAAFRTLAALVDVSESARDALAEPRPAQCVEEVSVLFLRHARNLSRQRGWCSFACSPPSAIGARSERVEEV